MICNSENSKFLNSLITGNRLKCFDFIGNLLSNNVAVEDIYEDHIRKALYDIGEMWEYGKISVASEHLATMIVEAILNELYLKVITDNKVNKKVITACGENEFHQVGIKMVTHIFEMSGWNTFFLGANMRTTDLIKFISDVKPDLIAISVSIDFYLPNLENMLDSIRENFSDLPVMVGGQAFRHGGQDILMEYKNATYFSDLYRIEQFLRK